MIRTLRFSVLGLCALLLASCGGNDGGDTASAKRDAKPDPRAGYFHEEQSTALNPLLADYDTASAKYYDGNAACTKRAERLFEAGTTAKESVQCHVTATTAYRDAVGALRTELDAIDGDFRPACDEQRATFATFLTSFEKTLDTYLADWNAYANGTPYPKIDQHARAVDTQADQFVNVQVPAITEACYTSDDRATADEA